jgi:L-ascorbate metabolism protein UlaG (beta-lactamase superfamily)
VNTACYRCADAPTLCPNAAFPNRDGNSGSQPPPDWVVEIMYVANEGVLLSTGGKRVLIDGLHREYKTYPTLPEPYLGQIEKAQAPFDKIDLILVSHAHRDHFDPESVGVHLKNNPNARLSCHRSKSWTS